MVVLAEPEYSQTLPVPEDVLFVMEVADTSLLYDRRTKMPIYAGAGIREAFIVNLNGGKIERFTEPVNGRCESTNVVGRGESIEPTIFPDLVLHVNSLLGIGG